MKKLTTVFLIIISVLWSSQSFAQKLQSDEGNFSIEFPCTYQKESSEDEVQTTHKFTCDKDNVTFFLGYTVHETEIFGHSDLAQVSVDSFLETVGGEMVSQEEWKILKNPGLKSVMTINDGAVLINYRVVLVDQNQYQLVVLAAKEDFDEKAAEKFFKSFKLEK
ncbi:MAG: hypothetical protein HWE07_03900 [Cytophagia bacterium]|nr:hypothetical protein [Cytophagia bacterium]